MTAAWRAAEEEIAALLGARHPDPFALLGPHAVADGVVVRAFVPGADTVQVMREGLPPAALDQRDPGGIFEGLLPGAALPWCSGAAWCRPCGP